MRGDDAFAELPEPWRLAFAEAWTSWTTGNFGIGAVLFDPSDGCVVAVGRNRVAQTTSEPGVLSGNMTAHAEMNAFAAMRTFDADGLHVYTTLQPCLMCAATAMLLKVDHIHFAADDEFFEGLDDLWGGHPLTRDRRPGTTGPFTGGRTRLGQFARLLPMSFTLEHFAGRTAELRARARHPELAALVDELVRDGSIGELRRWADVGDGLAAVWDLLPDEPDRRAARQGEPPRR